MKKTILMDLDGVLNDYDGVYDENHIPNIRKGAKEFIKKLYLKYEIKLFTTRPQKLAYSWLVRNNLNK